MPRSRPACMLGFTALADMASRSLTTSTVTTDSVGVRRYANTTCDLCGTPVYRRPSTLRMNKGKFCSRKCRNRAHPPTKCNAPPPPKGAANWAWKGGVTRFRKKGNYADVKYVRAPEWAKPMARKDGYIMEHRLIMANRIGRLMSRTEVVHHLDHDPLNNDPMNLELWPSNAAHKRGESGRFVEGVANRVSRKDLGQP